MTESRNLFLAVACAALVAVTASGCSSALSADGGQVRTAAQAVSAGPEETTPSTNRERILATVGGYCEAVNTGGPTYSMFDRATQAEMPEDEWEALLAEEIGTVGGSVTLTVTGEPVYVTDSLRDVVEIEVTVLLPDGTRREVPKHLVLEDGQWKMSTLWGREMLIDGGPVPVDD